MNLIILRELLGRWVFVGRARAAARLAVAGVVAGCVAGCVGMETAEISPSTKPLAKETVDLLEKKGMTPQAPIFVRVFKQESELEVWKQREDSRFYHFKTYPVCNWSGDLGPKLQQGDKQAPEGFYTIRQSQLNPNSHYHLAFNVGYPNTYDKAWGRTGSDLMVHGNCKSVGCYAMTDALIEEIYAIAREAFKGGQENFQVHAMPFRMTDANMTKHKTDKWYPFWQVLKQGYDHFDTYRLPPAVSVCEKKYVVNVSYAGGKMDPAAACPVFERPQLTPAPLMPPQQVAEKVDVAPGRKTRTAESIASSGETRSGLFGTGGFSLGSGKNSSDLNAAAFGFR